MSVILQVVASDPYYVDPDFWMRLFSTAVGGALGEQLGTTFGNVLHQVYVIGAGLLGHIPYPY